MGVAELQFELATLASKWQASTALGAEQQQCVLTVHDLTPVANEAASVIFALDRQELATLDGVNGPKEYIYFQARSPDGTWKQSRPYLTDYFPGTIGAFRSQWDEFINVIVASFGAGSVSAGNGEAVNRALYQASHFVACVTDVCRVGDRAGPGKFFEYATGIVFIQALGGWLERPPELPAPLDWSIPVDVVIGASGLRRKIVLATKITSRERIVQPFVHNFMLERAFPKQYASLILCGSETNRLPGVRRPLQETCVPGTIEAYRHFLGNVAGLHHLDLPLAYRNAPFAEALHVSTIGAALERGVGAL